MTPSRDTKQRSLDCFAVAEAYHCRISVDSSRAVVRYNCVRCISIGLVLLHFAAESGGSYKILPLMCEFYWLFADIF
jgi:hypothetical protein